MKVPGTGLPDLEGGRFGGGRPTCLFYLTQGRLPEFSWNFRGNFPKSDQAIYLHRHLCPVGAMGATARRHETVGATAKRPLNAPRYYSGHGEGPNSLIRPPSHAWRARQDGKSGRRGASDGKTASRPKRRSDRIPSPCTSGMPHAAGQSVPTRWHRR